MLARQSNMGEEATQKRSGQRKIAQTRNGDGSFWQMLSLSPFLFLCMYIYIYTSSTAQGGGGSFKNRKAIGEVGCCESGMAKRIH